MPNPEPMPAPDLDAMEALREEYESAPNETTKTLCWLAYTGTLAEVAPALIAKSRADDAKIAALREVASDGNRIAECIVAQCGECSCHGRRYDNGGICPSGCIMRPTLDYSERYVARYHALKGYNRG